MVGSVTRSIWLRLAAALLLVGALFISLSAVPGVGAAAATRSHASGSYALAPLDGTPTVTITATTAAAPTASPKTPAIGPDGPPPPAPQLSATAAELYNASTGKLMLAVAPNTSLPMASTTKIMTAVVALTYGRLDQQITISQDVVDIEGTGASIAGLRLGDTLSLRDLLYCLMLPSGDDAAIAIADGVAGSQANFVALMNLEAGLLGMSHTHYANAHGLDAADHYTSVSDLVRLTRYAMSSPTFAQVVDTASTTIAATASHHQYDLTNTNELLQSEAFAYDGAIGVKTGFTGPAGYCLVFAAKRSSGELIGVVLGEPTYNGRFTDAAALLNWGFETLAPTPTATPTSPAPTATSTHTP